MVYVDLNMVRAGAVGHPMDLDVCGYRDIHLPPKRYRVIDMKALAELLKLGDEERVQRVHGDCMDEALRGELAGDAMDDGQRALLLEVTVLCQRSTRSWGSAAASDKSS